MSSSSSSSSSSDPSLLKNPVRSSAAIYMYVTETESMIKFTPRTLSALETNASAPILLTAARADLDETYKRHHLLHLAAHYP